MRHRGGQRELDLRRVERAALIGIARRNADPAECLQALAVIDNIAVLFQLEHRRGKPHGDRLRQLVAVPVEGVGLEGLFCIRSEILRGALIHKGPESDAVRALVLRVLIGDRLRHLAVQTLCREGRLLRDGVFRHCHADAQPPAVLHAADTLVLFIPVQCDFTERDCHFIFVSAADFDGCRACYAADIILQRVRICAQRQQRQHHHQRKRQAGQPSAKIGVPEFPHSSDPLVVFALFLSMLCKRGQSAGRPRCRKNRADTGRGHIFTSLLSQIRRILSIVL